MKIFHDSTKAGEIEQKLTDIWIEQSQNRTVVHLSDTGYCPMMAYCRLIGIVPLPPDRTGIGKMTMGNIGQLIIQQLYPPECAEVEHDFIPSHADIMEESGAIIEIKISAQRIFRASDIPDGWRIQLMGYMSIHKQNIGWLLILNVFSGQWTAFKFIMSNEELEQHYKYISLFRTIVEAGGKNKDYTEVIKLMNDFFPDPKDRVKKCRYCNYRAGPKRNKLGMKPEGCPVRITNRDIR